MGARSWLKTTMHVRGKAIEAGSERGVMAPQHSLARSALLHLLPGAATLVLYVFVAAPIADALGYPSMFGFLLASVFVLVPVELGTLAYIGLRRNGRLSLAGVVLYRQPPPRRIEALVAALLAWSLIAAILSSPLDSRLRDDVFGWVPDSYLLRMDTDGYSVGSFVLMYVGLITISGVVAPIVEELYFRGFLLPRLSRFGIWAPILEMALFALYHVWSPWLAISRFVVFLPTVYAVWRNRSIAIGIWVHCIGNSLGFVLGLFGALARL